MENRLNIAYKNHVSHVFTVFLQLILKNDTEDAMKTSWLFSYFQLKSSSENIIGLIVTALENFIYFLTQQKNIFWSQKFASFAIPAFFLKNEHN